MQPKFPKMRLLLSNRLLESQENCLSTLKESAYELGLAAPGTLDEIEPAQDSAVCSSVFVASHILRHQLKSAFGPNLSRLKQQQIEELCTSLKEDINAYKQTANVIHEVGNHDSVSCSHMAPIVFDFLLQYLERYT